MATEYNHTNRIEEYGTTKTITITRAEYDYLRDLESRVKTVCDMLDLPAGEYFTRYNIIDKLRGEKEE